MSSETAATLRLANTSLRAWLVRLSAEPIALSPIQAQDLHDLLAELLRTSGCLRPGYQLARPPTSNWKPKSPTIALTSNPWQKCCLRCRDVSWPSAPVSKSSNPTSLPGKPGLKPAVERFKIFSGKHAAP